MTTVAIVTRNAEEDLTEGRLSRLAAALDGEGLTPTFVAYAEDREASCEAALTACAAVLVWVNPLQDGLRRAGLDAILRRVAQAGVLVSAHPDVIDVLGVKSVLARTAGLGWSGDAHHYVSPGELASEFPARVAASPRVLKPNRGNDGRGVRKVEMLADGRVQVTEAFTRATSEMTLAAFLTERTAEFAACDGFVDQAFQSRLGEGMIRCYLSADRVVGFGWQKVRALLDAEPSPPRTYSGPADPRFQRLRTKLEHDWAPALRRVLDLSGEELPALWDADFLFGPRDDQGEDTFVLCEINASSVSPMPAEAAAAVAATVRARLECCSGRPEWTSSS